MAYVPLDIRTEYSFGDGACRIEGLIERARASGLEAAGIADLHGTFGWVPFYVAARAAGIQPILGVTMHLELEDGGIAEIQLLARDRDGARNVMKLVSRAHLENPAGRPRVHLQDLEEFAPGVLGLDGGRRGVLRHALGAGNAEAAARLAARLRACFGADGFYVRLDRRHVGVADPLEAAHVHLAQQFNIPLVATPTVRGSDDVEAEAAVFLRRMQGEVDGVEAEPMLSERELRRLYLDMPEAVANTCVVAALCRGELGLEERRPLALPATSGNAPLAELRDACRRGARQRYRVGDIQDLPAAVRDRLAHELTTIEARELASCFLIVRDVVRHAKEEGIFVGPGYGSAAGSLVCYLTGITQVDPIQHGLSFERFIGRPPAVPEFVLEVERGRASEIGAWLTRRVGAHSVLAVAEIPQLGHAQALQTLARVEGFDATAVAGDPTRALDAGMRPQQLLSLHERARSLSELAAPPRHHPGSFLVTAGPATDSVAVARVPDAVVAQIDLQTARALGFLSIEIRPSRDLSALRECGRPSPGDGIDAASEAEALRVLARGDTFTVPGFESGAMLHLLQQLEPQDFEDLVAVLALEQASRRNPALVSQYTAAVAGFVPVDANPVVASILVETRNLLLYPEQVTAIAMQVAGMTAVEAEELRDALHRKSVGDLARGRARFVRGAVENQHSVAEAERLFGMLLRFDLHEFDKAHACGRVQLALEMAAARSSEPRNYAAALLHENGGWARRRREILVDAVGHGVSAEELEPGHRVGGGPNRKRRATNQMELGLDFDVPQDDLLVRYAKLWARQASRPASMLPYLPSGAPVRIAGVVRSAEVEGQALDTGHVLVEDPWGVIEVLITPRTQHCSREGLQHGAMVQVQGRLERKRGKASVIAQRYELASLGSEQGILFTDCARGSDSKRANQGAGSRQPNAERHPSRPSLSAPARGARRGARRAAENQQETPRFPQLGG